MTESPINKAKDLVTISILSNGKQIKDTYQVLSIAVEKAINRIPKALIKLQEEDEATKRFEASNSDDFTPGSEIEIQAGYEGQNDTIFRGFIVSMQIVMDSAQGTVLEVSCLDKAILMTNARSNAFYSNVTDSDVITSIIGKYTGLSSDVESTSGQHEELVQYDASDWDFMLIRADVNGLIVNVDQGKVSVKKPDISSSAVLSLTYGVDLIEFKADLNAINQIPGVEAVSWDMAKQQISSQSASNPFTTDIGNISATQLGSSLGVSSQTIRSSAAIDKEFLKSWADAKLLKSRLSMITGKAVFIGSALAKPDTIVKLEGVGDRFSGEAYISSVDHFIQEGKWTTELRFGLEDEWFASRPNVSPLAASGLTPEVGGLMIAKVKRLDQDPLQENRVLVKLPMMQGDDNGIWARMATFYATNKKGSFFMPEIDDEVILGFLNSDPNYPVILGSLYSRKSPPPYEMAAENYKKAIVTNSDCKIEFDDEKKIIVVQTPGGNKIMFSDTDKGITIIDENDNTIITDGGGMFLNDKNNNKILMSESGIEIESNAALMLTAKTDVTISGKNITNSAQIALKSSGQASAELSASGQTTIKGAMVMIN